jgi:hypothetical protein
MEGRTENKVAYVCESVDSNFKERVSLKFQCRNNCFGIFDMSQIKSLPNLIKQMQLTNQRTIYMEQRPS